MLVKTTLETTFQKNLSKSQKFPREIYVVEFCYSQTIFFLVHCNFTYASDLMILWHFILKLFLKFWSLLNSNCAHSILIIVSPKLLYSSQFHWCISLFLWRQNSKNYKIKSMYIWNQMKLFLYSFYWLRNFLNNYRTCSESGLLFQQFMYRDNNKSIYVTHY